MAEEITVIGIGVDTSEVKKGATDLDLLAAAGTRAEASAQKLESGLEKVNEAAQDAGQAAARIGKNMGDAAGGLSRTQSAAQALAGSLGGVGAGLSSTATGAARVSASANTAAQGLRGVGGSAAAAISGVQGFGASTNNANTAARGFAGTLNRLEQSSESAARALATSGRGLSVFTGALGGLSAGALVAGFVRTADAANTLNARLLLAVGSSDKLADAQARLFDISQSTGTGLEATADLFASLSRSTESLGVSQDRVLGVTESINQALAVSGASAQGAAAALIQLGQGFAAGTLRGEELNSVLEQAPRLARAIADGLGVPIGKLRELGAAGQLTGEQVFQALERSARGIEAEFNRLPPTVSRATQQAANSVLVLVGALDNASGSSAVLAGTISGAASAISALAKEIDTVAQGGESVSLIANAFVTAGEAVRVFAANVAFVFQAVGREAGAIFAQLSLVGEVLRAPPSELIETARRNWGQFNAISEAVKEDGRRAREELDRLERNVLSRGPRFDAFQTDRRELARRGRDVQGFGTTPTITAAGAASGAARQSEAQRYLATLSNQLRATEELTALERVLSDLQTGRLGKVTAAERQRAILLATQIDAAKALEAQEKEAVRTAQQRATARNAENQAIEDFLRAQSEARAAELRSLQERVTGLQAEEQAAALAAASNISLSEAIERVALARAEERLTQLQPGSEPFLALEREIAARREIIALIGSAEARDAGARAAREAADEWERSARQIEDTITDALIRGFEGGKDAAQNLRDTVENLFKTLVLRPVIQAATQGIAGGPSGGASDFFSTIGRFFGRSGSSGSSGDQSDAETARLGRQGQPGGFNVAAAVSYLTAANALANRQYGAAIGTAVGQAVGGPIGSAVGNAIGSVVDRLGRGSAGSPGFGSVVSDTSGSLQTLRNDDSTFARNFNGGIDAALRAIVESSTSAIESLTGEAAQATAKFATDATRDAFGQFILSQQGQVTAFVGSRAPTSATGGGDAQRFSVDPQQGIEEFAAEVARVTREALLAADLPQFARDQINALGADANLDELNAVATAINNTTAAIATVQAALQPLNGAFGALADLSADAFLGIAEAAGGFDALQAAASAYYSEFFTEAERQANEQRRLSDAFAELGTSLPASRDAFRDLVEAQDLTTESGRETFASLLTLAGAFDAFLDSTETAEEAVVSINEALQTLGEFRLNLQDLIEETRLRTLTPEARIASLRQTESRLFSELGTSGNPAEVAERLQRIILDRIREEARLQEDAQSASLDAAQREADLSRESRDAQIVALREQIAGAERLSSLSRDLAAFTAGLRVGDLSPLSFDEQLNEARRQYEDTLRAAYGGDAEAQGNVIGTARAYLEEARAFFGSSAAYAEIFDRITREIDQASIDAAAAAGNVDSLAAQLEALEAVQAAIVDSTQASIDTSQAELAALQALDAALASRLESEAARAAATMTIAQDQVTATRETTAAVVAQVTATSAGFLELQTQLATLNAQVGRLVSNADLQTAEP